MFLQRHNESLHTAASVDDGQAAKADIHSGHTQDFSFAHRWNREA